MDSLFALLVLLLIVKEGKANMVIIFTFLFFSRNSSWFSRLMHATDFKQRLFCVLFLYKGCCLAVRLFLHLKFLF